MNPPIQPDLSKLRRFILNDKPRITKFIIDWGLGQDENAHPNVQKALEGGEIMAKGTQMQDRANMMSADAMQHVASHLNC